MAMAMAADQDTRVCERSVLSSDSQPCERYKYLSVTKTGYKTNLKSLGEFGELKLSINADLKVSGTWSFTTNNGCFHTLKANGVSISFYPGTKTLTVQGSKSEIINKKLVEITSKSGQAEFQLSIPNTQTTFHKSDSEHEQQQEVEEEDVEISPLTEEPTTSVKLIFPNVPG